MRLTLRLSPSLTSAGDPRFRFRFLLFDVRICRRCDRPRFIFPVPVTLKRLAAPLCVFNFGIKSSKQPSAFSHQLLVKARSRDSTWTAQARLAFRAQRGICSLRRGLGYLRSSSGGGPPRPRLFSFFFPPPLPPSQPP